MGYLMPELMKKSSDRPTRESEIRVPIDMLALRDGSTYSTSFPFPPQI